MKLNSLAISQREVHEGKNVFTLQIRCGMLPRLRETVRHAQQIGVRIIAGADSGYTPDDPHRLLAQIDVIQAATSRAAECIGISGRTGAIRAGLEADLIVLDRNPLDDINAVRDVLLVVNDGRLAVNHLKF